jgi:hypothetical protein
MSRVELGAPGAPKPKEEYTSPRTDLTPDMMGYVHDAHALRLSRQAAEGIALPRSVVPAPTEEERTNLIDKAVSMRSAPGRGFTATEFVGITDIAVRLSDRWNVGGTAEDEAVVAFPSAKADGSTITVHHSYNREGVNVVFADSEGKPEKRIIVGEDFSAVRVNPDTNPAGFMDEVSTTGREEMHAGVVIFNENDPETRTSAPLSYTDAKFVGVELFKAALTEEERRIVDDSALLESPQTHTFDLLTTSNK